MNRVGGDPHPEVQGGARAAGGSVPPSHVGAAPAWRTAHSSLSLARPLVMGVINLTPDSFSDGGRYRDVDHALEVARAMVEAGAGVVDVGGESTRPGAAPVPAREELRRILPFVERAAADVPAPLSVDTRKAAVAHAALERGAAAINDVSGLSYDPRMGGVVAEAGAGLVLMHMRGGPEDMARRAEYTDVVGEVADELGRAVERALAAGVEREALVVDPGIGFAKGAGHSLALLGDLGPVRALGLPILVGPSRKSFLGAVLSTPVSDRLAGTLAACVAAYFQGARIFRVHDVEPVVQALAVAEAIARERIQREESTLEGSVR